MSKKSSSNKVDQSTQTTAPALVAILTQIAEFVEDNTLDSRCALRLVKRLRNEADSISKNTNATESAHKSLEEAFEIVDTALHRCDGRLLVKANAALREIDPIS